MNNSAQPTTGKPSPLPAGLRLAAIILLLATVAFWAAKGAHRGWSMNQVPLKQTDEVTGIEYVTYEKRFVPGVELLAGGAGLAAGLFAVSFFLGRKTNNPTS